MSFRTTLEDGRWLWEFRPLQTDLEVLQKLCRFRSPNMLAFQEVGFSQGVLRLVGQSPEPTEPVPAHPKPGDLARWSLHLAELATQLEHIGFPFNPRVEGLALKEGQIMVLDPGLEEFLMPGESPPDPIQRFGELCRDLCSESLPAHLEWITARCRSDSVIRYQSFAEIHEAFHQALIVELPESGQRVTKIRPLKNFQIPWLGLVKRVGIPWERVSLGLALLALLWGLVVWWWNRPLPPRNYPAVALTTLDQLHLMDLNTGELRARREFSSPVIQAVRSGDALWFCVQGGRRLLRLDGRSLELREGPVIQPNPALMVTESGGRRLYLLYPQDSRILVLELPETPLFYLDIWPECEFLAPILLPKGQSRGLLVASQDRLKCFDLQTRLPQSERECQGLSGLVVDSKNRAWSVGESGLTQMDFSLQAVEQQSLPAAPRQLMSVGSRLVWALSDRLVCLEADGTRQEFLAVEPEMLASEPRSSEQIWLVERKNQLVQRELRQGRSLKRWTLPFRPSGLTLLPPP